jgi:negative regulator of sigma-B (phosphoserine phosphatase)
MVKMKFGIATRPMRSGKYNGDMYLIKEFDHKILISLIDGLGHGEFAAVAASRCVKFIEEHYYYGLKEIFECCHIELRKTNGAVMGIVSIDFDHSSLIYAGVGNIGACLIGKKLVQFISRDGILGYRLPGIKEYRYDYTPGDTILLYSDGISSKVIQYPALRLKEEEAQELARKIMNLFGKDEDDASVIVAR